MKNIFCFGCLIVCILDILGDKWLFLIVWDMLVQGKKMFKEFFSFLEGIVLGILFLRLKWLEGNELILKQKLFDNKKENIYLLIEKGIELVFVIIEIILWSDKNLRKYNVVMYFILEVGFN